ncbi:hypothetical protein BC629DRAFT_1512279 [Irpex lacteus]|nr:hypothetical protein BC629DRAFT_1512279 [Irpex lacteus]
MRRRVLSSNGASRENRIQSDTKKKRMNERTRVVQRRNTEGDADIKSARTSQKDRA